MRTSCVIFGTVLTIASGIAAAAEFIATESFRDAVTVPNIRVHQQALQMIADANGGTRAAGTPGYDASGQYVADVLEAHGYTVTEQPFTFTAFAENSLPILAQVAPVAKSYTANDPTGFFTSTWSGSGDVTASVTAVDLTLPPAPVPSSTSGCEAADFAGFPAGNIALIQRGTCTFRQKAENAQAAGAVGVIFFNEGQPGRTEAGRFTLSQPQMTIPAVFASFAVGNELAAASGLVMRLRVDASAVEQHTFNLIAERAGCDESVLMLGAHLDSVEAGPGINDNGSGTATILDLAIQLAEQNLAPQRTVRFAWWGAEELGLLGSTFYVNSLSPAERAKIKWYLNFDMVGSPNYVRFIYDGDGSSGGALFPPGSDAIENVFRDYFAEMGLPVEELALTRSDNLPFADVGIPVGGLFTGAEGIKTAAEAADYGGTAGLQYDPCYHLACDTFDNVSLAALDEMSDAAAHALFSLAFDPSLCPRVSPSHKGSLLMYSKVELRWAAGPAGALRQDTVLELTNDYPDDVCVQLYFVNGDEPLDPVLDPVTGGVIVEGEPGWEWVDCQFCLTPDQTTYLSLATGAGAGCQPFTTLDPSGGMGPGRPDPTTPGERHLRGFVYAWAVDQQGYAINWNHLSGAATLVNYFNSDAWDYNAWAFQAHRTCTRECDEPNRCENRIVTCTPVAQGERIGEPGRIRMDGREYDFGFDMLLMDFFASGSIALSPGFPPPPALTTTITVDTDLTLHPITADLRQDSIGPVTTKAEFAIWNENERRFSGTTRCITCWDQTLLSLYENPNHFLRSNLQTDKGKARIDGVESTVCDFHCVRDQNNHGSLDVDFILDILGIDHVCSYNAALLGVVAKTLAFSGAATSRATAGRTLVGMGTEAGWIKWDIVAPPGTTQDDDRGLRGTRPVAKTPPARSHEAGAAQPTDVLGIRDH